MNRIRKSLLLYIILIASIFLVACDMDTAALGGEDYEDKLVVHFIDVGQGDSTLIEFPDGETSLIDGGTRKSSEKVVEYLKGQNIKKDRLFDCYSSSRRPYRRPS